MRTGFLKKINQMAIAKRRTLKKEMLITNILYGIAMVLVLTGSDAGIVLGLGIGMCGLFCGFVTAINLFKDLNDKQMCDVELSLPANGKERFWARILTFVYIQMIPLFISETISAHVLFIRDLYNYRKESTLWIIVKDYGKLWTLILMLLAAALFMIMIVAFCSSCTGTFRSAVFFSFSVAILQAVFPALLGTRIFENTTGIDWIGSHKLIYNFFGAGGINAISLGSFKLILAEVCINILISIGILLITERIYEKRDARVVGKAVSNRLFFNIVIILGIYMIYLALSFSSSFFWGVLIAAVCYFIIRIVECKKNICIKIMLKWLIQFGILTVAYIAFMAVSIYTGGFGYIYTEPKLNLDHSECEIDIQVLNKDSENKSIYNYNTKSAFQGKNLTDEQEREILEIFQKYMIDGRIGIKALFTDTENLEGKENQSFCALRIRKENVPKADAKHVSAGESYYLDSGWNMYFTQSLVIYENQAKEMYEELSKLSYNSVNRK